MGIDSPFSFLLSIYLYAYLKYIIIRIIIEVSPVSTTCGKGVSFIDHF